MDLRRSQRIRLVGFQRGDVAAEFRVAIGRALRQFQLLTDVAGEVFVTGLERVLGAGHLEHLFAQLGDNLGFRLLDHLGDGRDIDAAVLAQAVKQAIVHRVDLRRHLSGDDVLAEHIRLVADSGAFVVALDRAEPVALGIVHERVDVRPLVDDDIRHLIEVEIALVKRQALLGGLVAGFLPHAGNGRER